MWTVTGKHQADFSVLLFWQADPEWEVVVRVNGFDSAASAAAAGFAGDWRLVWQDGKLFLFLPDSVNEVTEDDLCVRRLSPSSRGKLLMDDEDYEVVDLHPADFRSEPGLVGGFDHIGYRVWDEARGRAWVNGDGDPAQLPDDVLELLVAAGVGARLAGFETGEEQPS